jgi:hypothetical protein
MEKDGFDLYRDGENLAFSNMAYFCLRTFQNDRFLSDHLRRFQRMMVQRTAKSWCEFFGMLKLDLGRVDDRTKTILLSFLRASIRLGYSHLPGLPARALDPAFTTAVNTCGYWQMRTTEPLKLIHDQSSSLAKDKWLWDFIASPDIQKMTIGVPGRDMVYPLNVTQVEFLDSRSHLQLQFCDVVAGASVAWCKQFLGIPYNKEYVRQLGSAGIEALGIGAIWPTPEIHPEKLGTKGMSGEGIEQLAKQLSKLRKKPKSR